MLQKKKIQQKKIKIFTNDDRNSLTLKLINYEPDSILTRFPSENNINLYFSGCTMTVSKLIFLDHVLMYSSRMECLAGTSMASLIGSIRYLLQLDESDFVDTWISVSLPMPQRNARTKNAEAKMVWFPFFV